MNALKLGLHAAAIQTLADSEEKSTDTYIKSHCNMVNVLNKIIEELSKDPEDSTNPLISAEIEKCSKLIQHMKDRCQVRILPDLVFIVEEVQDYISQCSEEQIMNNSTLQTLVNSLSHLEIQDVAVYLKEGQKDA